MAQFQAFLDDKGYEQERFWNWSQEAEQWLKLMTDRCRRESSKPGPENFETVFQTPNHPRVGVNWFEAVSFCKWLNEKLQLRPDSIRLPSELEWERAARGTKGRVWTSGDDTSDLASQCNIAQSQIGHTSAVDLFPSGDTPLEAGNTQGVADLAGNVWEWCGTEWVDSHTANDDKLDGDKADGESTKVARGGSWRYGYYPQLISPLYRGYDPGERYNDVGFRLVCFDVPAA